MSNHKNKQQDKTENNRPARSAEVPARVPHNHARMPKLSKEHIGETPMENPAESENLVSGTRRKSENTRQRTPNMHK